MNNENVFHTVKDISISRIKKGYSITIDRENTLEFPMASNFEWRCADGFSPAFTHMYFGSESKNKNEFGFNISFNEPCDLRITNGDPRCYIYVAQSK